MKNKLISFFDDQIPQGEALAKELGFSSFNALIRISLNEKIKKHSKILKNGKK